MSRSRRTSRISPSISPVRLPLRVAGLLMALVASAALISYVLYSNIIKPAATIYRLEVANAQFRAHNAQQARVNREARERITWLNSAPGAEEEGRKMGMVRPGEESVRLVVPPSALNAQPQQQETTPGHVGAIGLAVTVFALAFFIGMVISLRRRRAARVQDVEGVLATRSELERRRRFAQ